MKLISNDSNSVCVELETKYGALTAYVHDALTATVSFPDGDYLKVHGVPVRGYVSLVHKHGTLAGPGQWTVDHTYLRRTDRYDKTDISWTALARIREEILARFTVLTSGHPELLAMAAERERYRALKTAQANVREATKALDAAREEAKRANDEYHTANLALANYNIAPKESE